MHYRRNFSKSITFSLNYMKSQKSPAKIIGNIVKSITICILRTMKTNRAMIYKNVLYG